MGTNIIQSQLDNERQMIQLGVNRYRKNIIINAENKSGSITPGGLQLVREGVDLVAEGIREFLEDYRLGKPMKYRKHSYEILTLMSPEALAYISLQICVNWMAYTPTVQRVAFQISSHIEDEMQLGAFKEQNKALYHVVMRDLHKRELNYIKSRRTLKYSQNKASINCDSIPRNMKVQAGITLIDIICTKLGIFEVQKRVTAKFRTPALLCATPKLLAWIAKKNSVCELLSPLKLPCVIPPKDWTSLYDGGYYHYKDLCFVKTKDSAYLRELEKSDMSQMFKAVNTIQKTQWCINTKVYEVLSHYVNNEIETLVTPKWRDLPKLPYPTDGTTEQIIDWKRKTRRLRQENQRIASKRVQFSQLFWTATKFKDVSPIFFPHTIDFRGRVYAETAFLNPQGDDFARGLLTFAKEKPLCDRGLYWLQIHGANCYGYDKSGLDQRSAWADKNAEDIIECALRPFEYTWWMKADKPWQFLAFCFEYLKIMNGSKTCSLPITVDGSCNGLQHFAGMVLDEKGAKAVNVVSSDGKLADVYQLVADETIRLSEAKCYTQIQKAWEGKITRSIVKRPVMTTPYGATLWGMRAQVYEEIKKQEDKGISFNFGEDVWPYANYLAPLIYEAIGNVVQSARDTMAWLQQIAKIANSCNKSLYWYTPTGFLVKQKYSKKARTYVHTHLNGRLLKLSLETETKEINKQKQINSVSPNLVHSLDASHLMMTVNRCADEGIDSIVCVHDSFGTHAGDMDNLSLVLREKFLDIYKGGRLLYDYRDEVSKYLGVELPEPPMINTLDISKVTESEFFFS